MLSGGFGDAVDVSVADVEECGGCGGGDADVLVFAEAEGDDVGGAGVVFVVELGVEGVDQEYLCVQFCGGLAELHVGVEVGWEEHAVDGGEAGDHGEVGDFFEVCVGFDKCVAGGDDGVGAVAVAVLSVVVVVLGALDVCDADVCGEGGEGFSFEFFFDLVVGELFAAYGLAFSPAHIFDTPHTAPDDALHTSVPHATAPPTPGGPS